MFSLKLLKIKQRKNINICGYFNFLKIFLKILLKIFLKTIEKIIKI
jgi:hypothetical protein